MPEKLARRHFAKSIRAQQLLVEALRQNGQLARALAHAAEGDNGNTPLHAAARWDHQGAEHAVRLLGQARADLELKNAEGCTALVMALRRFGQNGKVASALKELGAREPPLEAVDPLAGALGGCVRPLVWAPAAAGVRGRGRRRGGDAAATVAVASIAGGSLKTSGRP